MTFLKTIVKDLLQKTGGDFSNITIVFPNKRASLFFNRELAEMSDRPVWSPQFTTISELFTQYSDLVLADHIQLVFELYESYREVTHSKENIDQFYSWGELMLADFDDVDKHLADAQKVFALVGDMHELDSTDYLTEEQRKALQQFFSNFTDNHTSELKQRFMQLWNRFYDIYTDYQQRLRNKGIAYEGMLYRDAVPHLEDKECKKDSNRTMVFCGFNLLNEVERKLFMHYRDEKRALYYWDFDAYYMPRKGMSHHEAGKYINEHLRDFPCALDYDNPTYHRFGDKDTDLTFISAGTDDLQARYVAQWLTQERIDDGRHTAIVLADESLLETVLHCLPPEVKHVNVTTGYPLASAPATSLVRLYMVMICHSAFTLHNINALLRHPYIKYVSDKVAELHQYLNDARIYYPEQNELALDENLAEFFAPLPDTHDHIALTERLLWLIRLVARNARDDGNDFANEGLFRMHGILNQMKTCPPLGEGLYLKLLTEVIQTTTIPFHGEPINGIQIMGVLETRNLDFDHLLLLSCNEGSLPAKVNDSSFIPLSVRRGYGLTTIDNKVAIYSYYFHRLLQRVSDATIVYNNSAADGKTGEMSRFMLQLLAESGLNIRRCTLTAGQATASSEPHEITKTQSMIDTLLQRKHFSPSAIGKYLRCPRAFYFAYVAGIRNEDEGDEAELDSRAFGNIFHKAAQLIYQPYLKRQITRSMIEGILNEKGRITMQRTVDEAFRQELFNIQKGDKRKTPRLGGLQTVNREMVLSFLVQLLRYDMEHAPFSILAVEEDVDDVISVPYMGKDVDIRFHGIIDRMDYTRGEDGDMHIRIIDYKTGCPSKELNLDSIEDIFNPENIEKHSDYFLQAMLYSSIKLHKGEQRPVSPGLLFMQSTFKDSKYDPTLNIDKKPILNAAEYLNDFDQGLRRLIAEILDIDKPFGLPANAKRCEHCDYCSLCNG